MKPYIIFLVIIKVIFLITVIMQKTGFLRKNAPIGVFIHKLFFIAFSLYMLWIFRPRVKEYLVEGETKLFLFVFAILVLLDLDWTEFMNSIREMMSSV